MITALERWKESDFEELCVYKVRCRNTTGLFVNVTPVKCLDYIDISPSRLDVLWSGRYDVLLMPSDIRLCKLKTYHKSVAEKMIRRRLQAIQSATALNKKVIGADLKCWNCPANALVERCVEECLSDQLSLSNITLF